MNSEWNTRRAWTRVLGSAAFGAAAMYVLDPDKGGRRRALVRDKAQSVVTDTRDAIGVAARDATHRIEGLRARGRRFLTSAPVPDDLQLIERVRARLGRLVSHPHAIQVGANNGRVTLSGPVLKYEAQRLLDAIRTVWGVLEVEDRLVVHDNAESISSLQNGAGKPDARSEFVHDKWAPAIRVAAMLSGTVLALLGMRQRSLAGCALIGAGLALTLRGAANQPLSRLAGLQSGTRASGRQQAIDVATPSEAIGAASAAMTARESA